MSRVVEATLRKQCQLPNPSPSANDIFWLIIGQFLCLSSIQNTSSPFFITWKYLEVDIVYGYQCDRASPGDSQLGLAPSIMHSSSSSPLDRKMTTSFVPRIAQMMVQHYHLVLMCSQYLLSEWKIGDVMKTIINDIDSLDEDMWLSSLRRILTRWVSFIDNPDTAF